MEDKLLDILDNLNISETSLLLEQDFDMHIDENAKKRIMNSVKSRSQLQFETNENILHKLKNVFNSLFVNRGFAVIMTIFILVTTTVRYVSTTTPVAYVSLDINPSIELAINKFKKVISYKAYNSDGEILLDNNDKRNITVDKAISNIISSAISKKYLLDNNNSIIAFATISNNLTIRKTLQTDLKNTVNNILKNKSIEANVISSNTDFNKRLEAKNFGFTVSKYTLVKELKSLDPNTVIADYKNMSIVNIEKKILELKNNTSKDANANISDLKPKVDDVNKNSNKDVNSIHDDKPTNNIGNSNSSSNNNRSGSSSNISSSNNSSGSSNSSSNNNSSGNSNTSSNNNNSGSSDTSSNNNNSGNSNTSSNNNNNSSNSNTSSNNNNSGNSNTSSNNNNSGNSNTSSNNNNSGSNTSDNNTDSGKNDSNTNVGNHIHKHPNKHKNPGHNHHHGNMHYRYNYHNNDDNYRYNY